MCRCFRERRSNEWRYFGLSTRSSRCRTRARPNRHGRLSRPHRRHAVAIQQRVAFAARCRDAQVLGCAGLGDFAREARAEFDAAWENFPRCWPLNISPGITFRCAKDAFQTTEFEAMWQRIAARLRAVLWCGGRVALHCADGRSRTAMVTGKLLVELGCPAQDALDRVRGARPGAISRPEEEQFICGQLLPVAEAAYRTQVSLAQPHRLSAASDGNDGGVLEGSGPGFDNPDQLELLQRSLP